MNGNIPNILVYHTSEADKYADFLRERGVASVQTASTPEAALELLPGTDCIMAWRFPTELLSRPEAASVRWIQSIGAGIEDLVSDPAIPRHIAITRIVDQFGGLIAEYVFAYLLLIGKELPRMMKAQSERRWSPFRVDALQGKVIGVAGLGSIGSEIVRKARAFDMTVYGLSFSGARASLVDRHFDGAQWLSFVKELDYLVLTLPLTEQTRQAVDRRILHAMKPEASLVNVGRGPLVSEPDLIEAMTEGRLRAAVLDVFDREPLAPDHPFWGLPNVYVTPHLSGQSKFDAVGQFFMDNLRLFAAGEPLRGIVNRERGY
ncbi:D-2-hydroxyacid dehydrogenase [Paenibacillus doosanensis]|uniref:D-2-hydroxyacid dehydrogenase n=1 Tax=Paenibacillus doosanensis TaxID=1229154 RepID=UPI00217FD0BF|nr:D-2-hydroxyacid dehydrogenase [Paenibacillus doosanensis]MCS7462281.1 D-2-hydroxyacid dehydrogenase [Paenibacillus doosanensis]